MTLSLLEKLCLRSYFMYNRLCGADKAGRKKLFTALKEISCTDSVTLDSAFDVSESEHIVKVGNLEEYALTKRLLEYAQLSGKPEFLSEREKAILEIKADGMRCAVERNLTRDEYVAGGVTLLECLRNEMKSENVHALSALGLFLSTGFFGGEDRETAAWMIKKSARWNNINGLLLALWFDPENRGNNLSRLYTACYQGAESELWAAIAKKHGVKENPPVNNGVYLLEKLFSADPTFNRNRYVSTYARILNTTLLSYEDKKRVLFSKNTETISKICDLPLKGEVEKERKADLSAVEAEIADKKLAEYLCRILTSLTDKKANFPLITGEKERLKAVKKALTKALKTFTVEFINAEYLTERELAKTFENVFVSRLTNSKDVQTVFIIENLDGLNASGAQLGVFLNHNYRKIQLLPMNITLDLSNCMFIGLSHTKPAWIHFTCDMYSEGKGRALGFAE